MSARKGIALAKRNGAWAGRKSIEPLWGLSKRELLEVALRLGAQIGEHAGSISSGRKNVLDELDLLHGARLL